MKVTCYLQFNNQNKEIAEVYTFKDIYGFKDEYRFAFYANKTFEMQIYHQSGPDWEAWFSETKMLPPAFFPPTITRPYHYIIAIKCFCGSDSVKSKRHSFYCPKYKQLEDT